jgi:hypothetical protein
MESVFESAGLRRTIWGRDIRESAHICAFFDSQEQEYECLGPYFAEGLAQGEQVVTIRDAVDCSDHVERLKQVIPQPLDAPIASDQLRVVASEEAYLQDGCFESERMYQMLESMLADVKSGPYKRVRTCGAMSWALREFPGTEELMDYESRVNRLTQQHDCTLMCVYDINKFSGRAVMDVLATHPLAVMGDRIYENPYYVEPTDFLHSLIKRGSAPLARNAG